MASANENEIPPVVDDPASLVLGWGTVLAAAYIAWWGWLSLGWNELTPVLAVLMGLCQGITNWSAVMTRDLWRRGAYPAAIAAGVLALMTGLITHQSLMHAWEVALERGFVTEDMSMMEVLLILFPYAEPLIFWIRDIRRQPGARRKTSAGDERRSPLGNGRPVLREAGKAALAAGAIAGALGAQPAYADAHVGDDAGQLAWRAQARDLWLSGLRNQSEIARRVGRPRETVRRELAKLQA